MKVLLVEDEPGIREGMSELIAEQAEVVAPDRVQDALAALQKDRFELVLTDLSMEGDRKAGFRIFESARRNLLPTALVTGSTFDVSPTVGDLKLQGMLEKPFTVDEAWALLERFVGLSRALDEAARRGPDEATGSVRWQVLAPGERLPRPERGIGFGFQVVEGVLRLPSGTTCGAGDRGFVAQGEQGEISAETPVRLVTQHVDAA